MLIEGIIFLAIGIFTIFIFWFDKKQKQLFKNQEDFEQKYRKFKEREIKPIENNDLSKQI